MNELAKTRIKEVTCEKFQIPTHEYWATDLVYKRIGPDKYVIFKSRLNDMRDKIVSHKVIKKLKQELIDYYDKLSV